MSLIHTMLSIFNKSAYKKGIRLYNENRFRESIDFFKKILVRSELSGRLDYSLSKFYCAQAYRNTGISLFATGNSKEALEDFKEALKLNAKHIDLFYFIGICENNLGNFKEAAEAFQNIIKIEPGNINTILKLAVTFYNMRMWEKTIAIYQTILEEKPGYADVHFKLGLAQLGNGDTLSAIKSMENALDINPDYFEARIKLSIVQIYTNELNQAEENLDNIIKKHPEFADVIYYKGLVCTLGNRIDDGIHYFKKSLEINPKYPEPKIQLVKLFCQNNMFDRALSELEESLRIDPGNRKIESLLSKVTSLKIQQKSRTSIVQKDIDDIFNSREQIEEAFSELKKQLKIMPNFSEMLSLLKIEASGEETESLSRSLIPLVKEYIAQNPEYPDLYNSLGVFYKKIKMVDEARHAFEKAVFLAPDYITARANLLEILVHKNLFKEALIHGKFLLSKNIEYPDILSLIGKVYYSLAMYEDVLTISQKILSIRASYTRANYLKALVFKKLNRPDDLMEELQICMKNKNDSDIYLKAKEMLQHEKLKR